MADTTFRLSSSKLPAGACFTTPQETLDLFARHLFLKFSNTASFFSTSAVEPPVDKRSNPWLKTTVEGAPLGWYVFYNGYWRRVPTVGPGTIQMYDGPSSVFNDVGLGKVNTDLDGWALCNGRNGTPDLRSRFVVAAAKTEGGVWKADIKGDDTFGQSGGEANVKLKMDHLPQRDEPGSGFTDKNVPTVLDRNLFKSNAVTGKKPNGLEISQQDSLPLPPWFSLAFVKFVGFAS